MSHIHSQSVLNSPKGFCVAVALLLTGCSSDPASPKRPAFHVPVAAPLLAPARPHGNAFTQPPRKPLVNAETGDLLFTDTLVPPVPLEARLKRTTSQGVSLIFLLFDDRNYDIAVADKEMGPETEWQTAQSAAVHHDAVAAINASFFDPGGDPLGLVIEDGKHIGTWNSQSSLTSGLLSVEKTPRLLRRQHWRSFSPTRHLIQAGPFLVENNAKVDGLSNRNKSPRSFIAWSGRHRWAFGVAEGATLAGLGSALAAQPLSDMNITTALNLDGGRSSDLWVSPTVPGGNLSTRKLWNNPVRNYLLLLPNRR